MNELATKCLGTIFHERRKASVEGSDLKLHLLLQSLHSKLTKEFDHFMHNQVKNH